MSLPIAHSLLFVTSELGSLQCGFLACNQLGNGETVWFLSSPFSPFP